MRTQTLCPSLAAALLALGAASSASASGVKAVDSAPSFKVRVHGVVQPNCSLTQSVAGGRFDNVQTSANTARTATLDLPFQMSCNTGFQVSLASVRSGLRTSAPNAGGVFAETIAYQARVYLPRDIAGPTCTSDAMAGACQTEIGSAALPDGILQGAGRIALTLLPGSKPLLAGDYSDSLVMTLSPALSGPGPL